MTPTKTKMMHFTKKQAMFKRL